MAGWPVNISSYRLGASGTPRPTTSLPGPASGRTTGATREEAEQKALKRAEELLARTRRHPVS